MSSPALATIPAAVAHRPARRACLVGRGRQGDGSRRKAGGMYVSIFLCNSRAWPIRAPPHWPIRAPPYWPIRTTLPTSGLWQECLTTPNPCSKPEKKRVPSKCRRTRSGKTLSEKIMDTFFLKAPFSKKIHNQRLLSRASCAIPSTF